MSPSRRSFLMLLAILMTFGLGIALTAATMHVERQVVAARFDRIADLVAGRMQQRMTQYIALLQATRAYLEADDEQFTAAEFSAFVGQLGLQQDYRGIQGIGLAPLVPTAETARASAAISALAGFDVQVHPLTEQTARGPIAMLEPQDIRNQRAIGYDMFSGPIRRAAMQAALDSGEARASGPVQLVQEITEAKQNGFLIFLPTQIGLFGRSTARDAGFVYAPFRAGDLHEAVLADLPGLPVSLRTVDIGAPDTPLFDTMPSALPRNAVTRDIDIAGRTWRMTLAPTAQFGQLADSSAGVTVGLLSLLLLAAVWRALDGMRSAVAAAEHSAELSTRQAEERTLLLREMQHRIKNHIARIQAIARQTARGAPSLAAFDQRFGARLQAMAKAQDALSRDGWGTADLRGLIAAEIGQVTDGEPSETMLRGEEVRLNGRAAQAMGLVAHELATNMMKYSNGDTERLLVTWRVVRRQDEPWLELDWIERGAQPGDNAGRPSGFGSQLIEALIEGDLEGRFERRFDDAGMVVSITFPLRA